MLPVTTDPLEIMSESLKNSHTEFKLITQTSYYQVYQARSLSSEEIHTIRVLDPSSELAKTNFNLAATLFFQEILRFCQLPGTNQVIFPELFEFQGNKIFFVSKPYYSLIHEMTNSKEPKHDINRLLKDLVEEMEYLLKHKKFEKFSFDCQRVFHLKDVDKFFLGDWASNTLPANTSVSGTDSKTTEIKDCIKSDISAEIYSLGCLALSVGGFKQKDLESLMAIESLQDYNSALEGALKSIKGDRNVKIFLRKMLDKEPNQRITLDELIKEFGLETKKVEPPESISLFSKLLLTNVN